MKKFKAVLLIATAFSTLSCVKGKFPGETGDATGGGGGPRPISSPAVPGAWNLMALGLELYGPGERDRELPSEGLFQEGLAGFDPVYLDDEIFLRKTIVLSGSDLPYLVVPEGQGDRKVDSLEYALRTQSPENARVGDLSFQLTSFDRDSRLHFVSLHKALATRTEDLSPSNQRILTFRVKFANAPTIYVTLRFLAAGDLRPPLRESESELVLPLHPYNFEHSVPLKLRKFVYRNTVNRPVRLWFRLPSSPARFALAAKGKVQIDYDNRRSWKPITWNGFAEMTGLEVTAEGSDPVILTDRGAWKSVNVGPLRQVRIEVLARTQGCGLEFPRMAVAHEYMAYDFAGSWQVELGMTDGWESQVPTERARSEAIFLPALAHDERRAYGAWNPENFAGPSHRFNCR